MKTSTISLACIVALGMAAHSVAQVPYGSGSFNTGHAIGSSPSYFSTSDSIFVLSGGVTGDPNGYLFDLQSTLFSTPKFQVFMDPFGQDFDSAIVPTPAVGSDGTIYAISQLGVLYAFKNDNSGTLKWTYNGINLDGLFVHGSPTVGLDGNIYVVTDDTVTGVNGGVAQVLYCIDSALGLPKWKLRMSQPSGDSDPDIDASPIFTTSGIYVPDEGGFFHFITFFGEEYPPVQIGNQQGDLTDSSPAIGASGFLYFGTSDGNLVVVDPIARQVLWTLQLSVDQTISGITQSPVLGPDGTTLYVARNDGQLFAVNVPVKRITAPRILAEMQLTGTSDPTTAATGSDGRIYIGDSAGKLYSLSLQPCSTCGTLPDQFVINWQKQVSSSPFASSSPLLAQVGTGHANNVVYAASQDGNIYAYYASSGPSSSTWSTFHGNGGRQGAYGSGTIPQSQLINVQFGLTNSIITKTGKAAYGNGSSDHWNAFQVKATGSFNPLLNNLSNSANQVTPVGISISGTLHGWDPLSVPFNDAMMDEAAVSYNGASFTLTISGLSSTGLISGMPAFYDIYLYADGGQASSGGQNYTRNSVFSINVPAQDPVTGNSVSTLTTSKSTGWSLTQWGEGNEYVVFRNVPVSASGQTIIITATPDMTNPINSPVAYTVVNGIQIVARQ